MKSIGIAQIEKADSFLARRREIAKRYTQAFRNYDYLVVPPEAEGHAWHLYLLSLVPELLTIDRDEYASSLLGLGIGTSVHFKPLHLMSYYRDTYNLDPERFPRSNRRFRTVLSLPIYPLLEDSAVDRIIESIVAVGDRARR